MKNYSSILFLLSLLIAILFCSCGDVNLKDDKDVATFLRKHDLEMDGDWNFYKDGTFDLKPASPNDPTQLYKGTWSLGKYWECEVKGCDLHPTREITLSFANYGHVTDAYSFNGTNFEGSGRTLYGTISYNSIGGWYINFKNNNYTGGWVVDENGNTQLSGKSSFNCNLKEKSSDEISSKESAGLNIQSNSNSNEAPLADDTAVMQPLKTSNDSSFSTTSEVNNREIKQNTKANEETTLPSTDLKDTDNQIFLNQIKSQSEMENQKELIDGCWFIPHNATTNIHFFKNSTFRFKDFNDKILTGTFELDGHNLYLHYNDRPKQRFYFYKGSPPDTDYHIKGYPLKTTSYYFVRTFGECN